MVLLAEVREPSVRLLVCAMASLCRIEVVMCGKGMNPRLSLYQLSHGGLLSESPENTILTLLFVVIIMGFGSVHLIWKK